MNWLQPILGQTLYFVLQIVLVILAEACVFFLYLDSPRSREYGRVGEVFVTLIWMLIVGLIFFFFGPEMLFYGIILAIICSIFYGISLIKDKYQRNRDERQKQDKQEAIDRLELETSNKEPVASIVNPDMETVSTTPSYPEFLGEIREVKPPL